MIENRLYIAVRGIFPLHVIHRFHIVWECCERDLSVHYHIGLIGIVQNKVQAHPSTAAGIISFIIGIILFIY
jgi:hypothetical protein